MTVLDSSEPSFAAPDGQLPAPPPTNSVRFKLDVQMCDGCAVIAVWGELYADAVGELTRLVHSLTAGRSGNVVLDVSRLYDLDADSIAELARLRTDLTARRADLSLAAPRPWVRRLLESTCRKGTFPVHSTVGEAIAQTREPAAAPRRRA